MEKKKQQNKIVAVVGPTAAGKTGLAVKLADNFKGEIISADSRQVYRYMDIGTGKDLADYKILKKNKQGKESIKRIPYHLIDVASPNTNFDLSKFIKRSNRAVEDIFSRGRLPIIAGGTGLYAQALVDGYDLSLAGPDIGLRNNLEKKDLSVLLDILKKKDPEKFKNLNKSERANKRRLIRYIEIARKGGRKSAVPERKKYYEYLVLGITWPRELLKKRIYKRLFDRLEKEHMVKEVIDLHKKRRVSWKRLNNFGLEYKYISEYLRGTLDYLEMADKLNAAIAKFAKRQMSWYRRWERQGRKIHWVKSYGEAEKKVNEFLKRSK